jgi:hypothetical protein
MMLRPHRRNLVVWSSSVAPVGRYGGAPRFTRVSCARWMIRTGALLTVVGLIRLARVVRARWPALAGGILTLVGLLLRGGPGDVVLLPGLLLLLSAPLIPPSPKADHMRRSKLERELATYSTPAQRRDLEATLDLYPDDITYKLRDILASQTIGACNHRIPGGGLY